MKKRIYSFFVFFCVIVNIKAQYSIGVQLGITNHLGKYIDIRNEQKEVGINVELMYKYDYTERKMVQFDVRYLRVPTTERLNCNARLCPPNYKNGDFIIYKQFSTSLLYEYKAYRGKKIDWNFAAGINSFVSLDELDNNLNNVNYNYIRLSMIAKSLIYFKITERTDFQFVTNIFVGDYEEFGSNLIQMNFGIVYKLLDKK